MSWTNSCLSFVRKYGKAAKVVAGAVLNVVAPGSGSLVALVDLACDHAHELAQEQWEAELTEATRHNSAELERLGRLFDLLAGALAGLCDKALAFADQPDELPDIVRRALAADPALSRALHDVEDLKAQFRTVQDDLRRIARNQEEALPVYARMNRVCDYFDELWELGVKPRDLAEQVRRHHEASALIAAGRTAELDAVLPALHTAASVCVLEAAAAARTMDYPAAQRALTRAVKLRPSDAGLLELSRHITILTTSPAPSPAAKVSPSSSRLQPGDTLDGWRLEDRLGAGGWGQVFRATREGQARAVKVMHPDYAADAAFVARFKTEIAALLRLPRHPNLVGIHADSAFGYCDQRRTWYLAMEHIDGPTLESHLATNGPLSEGRVRMLFTDAVAGLAEAHRAGIVHRDIKPANLILRQRDERLVFVDFGLAVAVEDLDRMRVGGLSVLFAAPEQHYGEPATQCSDVFSLCAVLHYALNYDKPDLRRPNRFTPGLIPDSLRDLVARGMKPNPDERFRDAGQLLAALAATMRDIERDYEAYLACNRRGTGTKRWLQDHIHRLGRWQQGADQGNARAMMLLGDCCAEGIGRAQDYGAAMLCFRKAADGRVAAAMKSIGWLYDNGWGVAADPAAAFEWYRKAADTGDAEAMLGIGEQYVNGLGVDQDYRAAMQWFRRAADAGASVAMNNIGWLYQHGHGVGQDHRTAMQWYRKAADAGDVTATNNVGWLYANGWGVAQDYAAALQWFRKAAAAGDAEAMERIGWLCENGWGTAQDRHAAREWYRKAVVAGSETAAKSLARLDPLAR